MKVHFIILTLVIVSAILNTSDININDFGWENDFKNYWDIHEKMKKRINM